MLGKASSSACASDTGMSDTSVEVFAEPIEHPDKLHISYAEIDLIAGRNSSLGLAHPGAAIRMGVFSRE